VAVTTNIPDCEVTIDDELVGKTPFREPVLVSIGRRKITAMREGRPAETRFVDVAAGDTVQLPLSLTDPNGPATPTSRPSTPPPSSRNYAKVAWYTTGALGVVGVGFGAAAFLASRDLKHTRDTAFPVSEGELSRKASRVTTLSLVADSAAVAAGIAFIVGLYLRPSQSKTHEVRVALVPNGIQLAGVFQ
jgi:hypothetical protein